MKLKAYGKINLFLKVLDKREDGYHNIETVIQRVDLFDEIDISIDKSFNGIHIEISCDNKDVPTDHTNLCHKACSFFMNKYNLKGKVYISIKKNIPVAAGMGGGTSDGAYVLKYLSKEYNLNIDLNELCMQSSILGADFPYSLIGGTVLCEGIGEKLTKLPSFSNRIIVIVKPNFGFSTKDVYTNFKITNSNKLNKEDFIKALKQNDFYNICKNISNDLENSNLKKMEFIQNLKHKFKNLGCLASCMSGSGSSVYGVFKQKEQAQKCYNEFKKEFNEVYITHTIDI